MSARSPGKLAERRKDDFQRSDRASISSLLPKISLWLPVDENQRHQSIPRLRQNLHRQTTPIGRAVTNTT